MPEPPPPVFNNPSVDEIPQASQLHQQLNTLNNAIYLLDAGGATLIGIAITAPPVAGIAGTSVTLDPPIDDPQTLADLAAALQAQADAVAQQLNDMGYTDAVASKVRHA